MTTAYFLNCVMGNVFGSQTEPSLPTKYFVGLSSTQPREDGSGVTEPAGGGYARVEIDSFAAPDHGTITNTESISFEVATEDWGDALTHYVIFDENGTLLLFDALEKSRIVQSDTQFYFKPSALTLTLRSAT